MVVFEMAIKKKEFEDSVARWLENHAQKKYGNTHDVEILHRSYLARDEVLKKSKYNHSNLFFAPHFTIVLTRKEYEDVTLILVTVSTKTIALKEIGELRLYCRMANPVEALLLSADGLSSPVETMLLSEGRDKRLLRYDTGKDIEIWRFDADNDKLDGKRIMPL